MNQFEIRTLSKEPEIISQLTELLIATVANGDSVSFMHPLEPRVAQRFWEHSLAEADHGSRVVLGAFDGDKLVGTVTLLLDFPPNQPHRGEIAKMITSMSHRGRGIASKLLKEAERIAAERGRSLICLDTAEDGGAAGFYEKSGYQRTGLIPDFALKPFGGFTGTIIFWKRI